MKIESFVRSVSNFNILSLKTLILWKCSAAKFKLWLATSRSEPGVQSSTLFGYDARLRRVDDVAARRPPLLGNGGVGDPLAVKEPVRVVIQRCCEISRLQSLVGRAPICERGLVKCFLRVPQSYCSFPAAQASKGNSQKIVYKTSSPSNSPS